MLSRSFKAGNRNGEELRKSDFICTRGVLIPCFDLGIVVRVDVTRAKRLGIRKSKALWHAGEKREERGVVGCRLGALLV